MRKKTPLLLAFSALLSFACGNLSAQNETDSQLTANTQAITNNVVTNPDVLVLTGKIVDAVTNKPIANAKINFDKFGEEMLQASIDEKGNYALALDKKELGEPVRIIFKISGYKRYTIKNVDKTQSYMDADIFLQPMDSEEKSNANVKYIMNDDPFNTMVIKMQ